MLFIRVTENWKSAQTFMNSVGKNSVLLQVLTSLKKSEEFLYLRNKKVIHIKKKGKIFTLSSLFCLHQTSKNKKVTGAIIHNSSEVILLLLEWNVWFISLWTLTLTEREDKTWDKLTILLKTCHKLTKIQINNIMTKNTKK